MIKNINDYEIIITKGTRLFHGTGERFDKRQIRTGGYDDIFWTTDSSAIAQTYIPTSPAILSVSTSHIVEPTTSKEIQNIQKLIGINYDTSKFEINGNQIVSYQPPSIFKKIEDKKYKLINTLIAINKALKKYSAYADKYTYSDSDKLNNDFFKKWGDLEDYKKKLENEYRRYLNDDLKLKYVNNKLMNLGYKPDKTYSSNNDYRWDLKFKDSELQPSDFKFQGRLLIVIPKRDLKLFDATYNGEREADLMNLDYHRHDWFEMAKKKGYDGIKINDFAQSDDYGNVSHYSYGLFEDTLKDLDIKEIKAKHNNLDPHFKSGKWQSPEYEKMKDIIKEEFLKIKKYL